MRAAVWAIGQPGWLLAGLLVACASEPPPPAKSSEAREAGRLAPEVIQGTVRNAWPDVKTCYERGLARDAKLEGRLSVRFIIETDGSVRKSGLASSSLPDIEVAYCIVGKFTKLHFPSPEGGAVTVVYPIMLSPG
ncbi:MAG TPA: AgmX/PglI C-terminal domain-containing protein [Polyangiaceae bacterium]|jgi:hypothetical protein